jgi:hypothetical protein
MTSSAQKGLETVAIAIGNVLVGAISGYQHFHIGTGIIPGCCLSSILMLYINWDSVQFAIKTDRRAVGRPFWPMVILAVQAFTFYVVVLFALQLPAFLLAAWIHR